VLWYFPAAQPREIEGLMEAIASGIWIGRTGQGTHHACWECRALLLPQSKTALMLEEKQGKNGRSKGDTQEGKMKGFVNQSSFIAR
jgi:hypothetical protein